MSQQQEIFFTLNIERFMKRIPEKKRRLYKIGPWHSRLRPFINEIFHDFHPQNPGDTYLGRLGMFFVNEGSTFPFYDDETDCDQ